MYHSVMSCQHYNVEHPPPQISEVYIVALQKICMIKAIVTTHITSYPSGLHEK